MRYVICDDDMRAAAALAEMLHACSNNEDQVEVVATGQDLLAYIEKKDKVDAVFLDIVLDEENGIALAEKIQEQYPTMKIVFITGYLDYARDIFVVRPTYFLVKPFHLEKVEEAVQRICQEVERPVGKRMIVQERGVVAQVPLGEILYLENNVRVANVITKDVTYRVIRKLDEIMLELDERFLRCHQSYIVNMKYVRRMNQDTCILLNGTEIPVSQSKRNEAKKRFMQFLGGSL